MKYSVFILVILSLGCQPSKAPEAKKKTSDITIFNAAISMGEIKDDKIREASGLIASINNPGMLWTHNDSGNDSDIFLLNEKGEVKCTVHLAGIKNRDWEDITIGAGPEKNKTYLYIGEIGDNGAVYYTKYLYRIEEPRIAPGTTDVTISKIDTLQFNLPDGARDTEALMIDPVSNNFYLISKRENQVNLYRLSWPATITEPVIAQKVLEKMPFSLIVAADISKDGSEILAKNYDHVFYWKRLPGESIEISLMRAPITLPYIPEPQGEAIAFDRDGKGYYTISEKKKKMPQHLFFYKRK